jgi:hypothetical protein
MGGGNRENFQKKKSVKLHIQMMGGAKTINLRLKWPMTSFFFSFKYNQKKWRITYRFHGSAEDLIIFFFYFHGFVIFFLFLCHVPNNEQLGGETRAEIGRSREEVEVLGGIGEGGGAGKKVSSFLFSICFPALNWTRKQNYNMNQ